MNRPTVKLCKVLAAPVPRPPATPNPHDPGPVGPSRFVEHAASWAVERPWLLGLATLAVAAAIAGRQWLDRWRHRRHCRDAQLVTVAPPPEVDAAGAAALWANLYGTLTPARWRRRLFGAPHVVWQYSWAGRRLSISCWVPGTVPAGGVEAAIRGAWPGATVITTLASTPIPLHAQAAAGGQLQPQFGDFLPLATDLDADPLRALCAAGSGVRDGEYACVQVLARPAPPHRVRRARHAAARLRDGRPASTGLDPGVLVRGLLGLFADTAGPHRRMPPVRRDPAIDRDARAILERVAHPLWTTGIRYAVAAVDRRGSDPTGRLNAISAGLAAAFAVYTGRNRLTHRTRMRHPIGVVAGRRLGAGFLTSAPELALLAGLPQDLAVPGLDRAGAKPVPPPVAVPTGGRGTKVLGHAQIGGHAVALPVVDARHHLHILGATGSGKTTLLGELIVQDVMAGRGTVVIDPHGDLVLDVLDRLPASVASRLVLFDPDQPHPPVLNPLDGTDHHLLVDNLVAIMGSIFAKAWGPRMDDVMRVACLTLLKHKGVTLQHIPSLLTSAQFRAEWTAGLDDPEGLSGFWAWYDELSPPLRAQVIGPVLARLRSFVLRDFVKQTMGYPHSSFDMGRVLDGGVLLARLSKGVLGEETSRLMGSLILARVWQAATARAATGADRRRDCTVVLDEAHNFLTLATSLDTMLAEARKYRLSMVLAHQDLAQFPRELLAAVSANARNKIYFACSPEDAHVLSRHTVPELDTHDLTHLDAYTAAARLVIAGRPGHAFTLTTRPPRPLVGQAAAIRAAVAAREPDHEPSPVDEKVRRAVELDRRRQQRAQPATRTPATGH